MGTAPFSFLYAGSCRSPKIKGCGDENETDQGLKIGCGINEDVLYYGKLAVFGLCIIASISGGNMAKGLICGFLGILTATVGIDSVTSYIRFTDNANLLSGIQYIPVMIGLFAMSQAFETIEDIYSTDEIDASVTRLLPCSITTRESPSIE